MPHNSVPQLSDCNVTIKVFFTLVEMIVDPKMYFNYLIEDIQGVGFKVLQFNKSRCTRTKEKFE